MMVMRAAHAFFAVVFAFAAALQFNDPHPVPWVLLYGLAAVSCGAAWARHRLTVRAALPVGIAALVWGLTYLPSVLRHGQVASMFDEWTMRNAEVLESREMFGLLLVAAWMAVIVWDRRRSGDRK